MKCERCKGDCYEYVNGLCEGTGTKPEPEQDFSVYMVKYTDDSEKIRWEHATDGATMFITKNSVTIELTPEEIKSVVKSAGGNFRC